LEREFQLEPRWTINIPESENSEFVPVLSESIQLLYFKLGQKIGYFSPSGQIFNVVSFPQNAVISPYYYAAFSQNAVNTPFYKNTGELAGQIMGSGFPFFDEDRIYLFHPGGASLSQCRSEAGSVLWSYEGYAPILAFASSAGGSAIGAADGSIIVHTPEGTQNTTIVPGGSAYPVVLGLDISDSGKQIASISGLQKQRFVLTEISQGSNKILYHEYFDADANEQSLVHFSSGDKMVYFSQPQKLTVLNCSTFKTTEIPIKGKILSIIESVENNLVFALTKSETAYSVYILENYNMLLGSFSFKAEHTFIRASGKALYIGKDSFISKLEISRK
jgi:hypothetical protein